jgi:hypothetical protein
VNAARRTAEQDCPIGDHRVVRRVASGKMASRAAFRGAPHDDSNPATNLDLRLLRVSTALLDTGGVGRTAKWWQSRRAQSATPLFALRRSMGDQLFVHDARGVSPTHRALATQPRPHGKRAFGSPPCLPRKLSSSSGGPGCLDRIAVWISRLPLVGHAAGRSG